MALRSILRCARRRALEVFKRDLCQRCAAELQRPAVSTDRLGQTESECSVYMRELWRRRQDPNATVPVRGFKVNTVPNPTKRD